MDMLQKAHRSYYGKIRKLNDTSILLYPIGVVEFTRVVHCPEAELGHKLQQHGVSYYTMG